MDFSTPSFVLDLLLDLNSISLVVTDNYESIKACFTPMPNFHRHKSFMSAAYSGLPPFTHINIRTDEAKQIHRYDDQDIWVRFSAGAYIFLFSTASSPTLGPTQSPVQLVPGTPRRGTTGATLSCPVRREVTGVCPVRSNFAYLCSLGREADHSPPSNAEVRNAWRYNSTNLRAFMAWC